MCVGVSVCACVCVVVVVCVGGGRRFCSTQFENMAGGRRAHDARLRHRSMDLGRTPLADEPVGPNVWRRHADAATPRSQRRPVGRSPASFGAVATSCQCLLRLAAGSASRSQNRPIQLAHRGFRRVSSAALANITATSASTTLWHRSNMLLVNKGRSLRRTPPLGQK